MSQQTKKLSDQATTTTVAAGEKFPKVNSSGAVTLISAPDLQSQLFGGVNPDAALDGVRIASRDPNYGNYELFLAKDWPAKQAAGRVADGVAVIVPGRIIIVAPHKANLPFCSANHYFGCNATPGNFHAALADFEGKAHTAAIIAGSSADSVSNTASYAPGYCNLYSNGSRPAGSWWLPSAGELAIISANVDKINCCLSLIPGATLIDNTFHTSSTENGSIHYICIGVRPFVMLYPGKESAVCTVRPVTDYKLP